MNIQNIFLFSLFWALISGSACDSRKEGQTVDNHSVGSLEGSSRPNSRGAQRDVAGSHSVSSNAASGEPVDSSSGVRSETGEEVPPPQSSHESPSEDNQPAIKRIALLYQKSKILDNVLPRLNELAHSPGHPLGEITFEAKEVDPSAFQASDLSHFDCSVAIAEIPYPLQLDAKKQFDSFSNYYPSISAFSKGILLFKPTGLLTEARKKLNRLRNQFVGILQTLNPNIFEFNYLSPKIDWGFGPGNQKNRQEEFKVFLEQVCFTAPKAD